MTKKSDYLPEEVIIEILLRLPVKTVLCCKCVCKSWFSLISDPNFAISHFQLAASPTHKLVCLGKISEILSIDFNASLIDDSSYASLSDEFLPRRVCPEIGGSCRGFIFLHTSSSTLLYLWNPSTGVHTNIPASPQTTISNGHLYTSLYGFAYDHSTDDYLIVLGSSYSPTSTTCLEIFSLTANKWKQIELPSHFPYWTAARYEDVSRAGLLLNGAIHWMVYNHEISKNVIIAFHLKDMTISEIPLPYDFVATVFSRNCGLLVLGGLISAWSVERPTVKIWVIQNYAVHSSWTKTLVFSIHTAPYLFPVCFTNSGDIIGIDGEGGLVKFNDQGQLLEHHSYSYGNCYFKKSHMGVYTESMLSLPSGTEQP